MNVRTPGFRLHASGQFLCHYDGRNHYLGRDRDAAYGRYLQHLQTWAQGKKDHARGHRFERVIDLAEAFFRDRELESGVAAKKYHHSSLMHFLRACSTIRICDIRPTDLHALKQTMLEAGYAPKTINHNIGSVKTMFKWAAGLELIPAVNFDGVKKLRLGPPIEKAVAYDEVLKLIGSASAAVRPWLAVNYLTMARPVEVVRLVHGQGEWIEPWLFRLTVGKTDKSARQAKHLVFSSEALTWLDRCAPVWSRLDSYSNAVRRHGAPGPHILRHSAATHLHQQGVAWADCDLLLGHLPPRVTRIYVQIDWRSLRETVGRLTLQSVA